MQDDSLEPLDGKEQKEPLRKRLTRWAPASCFRLGRLRFGGVLLTGVTLLALAMSGLLLPTSAAAAASFKPSPRPTATPTTMPSATPTPRPTATRAPSPTAPAAATPAATSTAVPGATTGATTGGGPGKTQTTTALGWSLLLWGLGGVVAALLIGGICLWLFARRPGQERQSPPVFPSSTDAPSRQRLNQLHQLLPARTEPPSRVPGERQETAETRQAPGDTSHPWSTPSELPWAASPNPPQWLIEAGLLQHRTKEAPPDAGREP